MYNKTFGTTSYIPSREDNISSVCQDCKNCIDAVSYVTVISSIFSYDRQPCTFITQPDSAVLLALLFSSQYNSATSCLGSMPIKLRLEDRMIINQLLTVLHMKTCYNQLWPVRRGVIRLFKASCFQIFCFSRFKMTENISSLANRTLPLRTYL